MKKSPQVKDKGVVVKNWYILYIVYHISCHREDLVHVFVLN